MKDVSIASAFGLIFVLATLATAAADRRGCRSATEAYKSAKSEVADNLRSYADCIHASDGRDDCSAEFSRLKSAQDDFETAVSAYEDECK
jgi:hypothetical protein